MSVCISYIGGKNQMILDFSSIQSNKLSYSIYGDDSFILKGVIETNIDDKPIITFNVATNNQMFIKIKELRDNDIVETVKFINVGSLKKKNNLKMRIIDKDTDTLFKSINSDGISELEYKVDGSTPYTLDSVLDSINLLPCENVTSDSDSQDGYNYGCPTDTSENENNEDNSKEKNHSYRLRSNRFSVLQDNNEYDDNE